MRNFWIPLIILVLAIGMVGHSIVKVLIMHLDIELYNAQTKRIEVLDYACGGIPDGRDRAFIIGNNLIKCGDVIKDYVPSEEKVSLL